MQKKKHTLTHSCTRIHICTCIYIYNIGGLDMQKWIRPCWSCRDLHGAARAHIHIHVCVYTHTHTHTYKHSHIYTHVHTGGLGARMWLTLLKSSRPPPTRTYSTKRREFRQARIRLIFQKVLCWLPKWPKWLFWGIFDYFQDLQSAIRHSGCWPNFFPYTFESQKSSSISSVLPKLPSRL